MIKTDWSGYLILIVFVGVTLGGLAFGLMSVYILWGILRLLGLGADYWVMTEALATAVTAAAVLGAGFVAYQELAEIASSRHMEVADRLFEELNSEENIAARRWVYQNLVVGPQEGMRAMTPEGQAMVKKVLNSLDRVAFLTQAGWIPEEMVMPWMNPMIAKAWDRLEPYVFYERERRNEPEYYRYAGELADRCRSWREQHFGDVRVKWVEDAL